MKLKDITKITDIGVSELMLNVASELVRKDINPDLTESLKDLTVSDNKVNKVTEDAFIRTCFKYISASLDRKSDNSTLVYLTIVIPILNKLNYMTTRTRLEIYMLSNTLDVTHNIEHLNLPNEAIQLHSIIRPIADSFQPYNYHEGFECQQFNNSISKAIDRANELHLESVIEHNKRIAN